MSLHVAAGVLDRPELEAAREEVLARYRERGIPVVRTDRGGTVRLRLDERGLRVRQEAIGPWTWFSGERRARAKNTVTAKIASPTLMPWL